MASTFDISIARSGLRAWPKYSMTSRARIAERERFLRSLGRLTRTGEGPRAVLGMMRLMALVLPAGLVLLGDGGLYAHQLRTVRRGATQKQNRRNGGKRQPHHQLEVIVVGNHGRLLGNLRIERRQLPHVR